jgi:hypothetical protein
MAIPSNRQPLTQSFVALGIPHRESASWEVGITFDAALIAASRTRWKSFLEYFGQGQLIECFTLPREESLPLPGVFGE